VPTHAQMLFDLADGPALHPIQVMQIVDLVRILDDGDSCSELMSITILNSCR